MEHNTQGFSLVEALVALFLTSTVSLGLLDRQCQFNHFLNQSAANFRAAVEGVNPYEMGE